MAKIADLYADIRGDTSNLKSALNSAKGDLKSFGNEVNSAGGQAAFSFQDVALGATKVAAAVVAIGMAAKKAFEFGAEGAQISSLGLASKKLAASYGTSMNDIVDSVKKASFNTITEYDAMKSANLAMTMGVSANADEIGNLLQIAMMRARAFGLTTEEAFDRITVGIGRRSTKVLDDLGFNIIGATSVQDLFNQVLEQGNKELADMGGLTMDVSSAYQRVGTVYKDFFNQIKEGAGYGLLPVMASGKEVENIQKERAAVESAYGSWEEYSKAMKGAASSQWGFIDSSGNLVKTLSKYANEESNLIKSHYALTYSEFANAQGMAAKNEALIKLTGWTKSAEEETVAYNNSLIVQNALSSDIAEITEKYASALEDAGRNQKKITAARAEASKSTQGEVFGMAVSGLDPSTDSGLIRELAIQFGQMTEEEGKAAEAMGWINDAYEKGKLSAQGYKAMTQNLHSGLMDVMAGGQSNYYIDIWIRTHGSGMAGVGYIAGEAAVNYEQQLEDIAKGKITPGGKHGATFIGMAHGGAVVPPGFSNDGMMIRVSSGEELTARPAGNNNLGGDSELTAMIADLKYTMDGLPRLIRDAVMMT